MSNSQKNNTRKRFIIVNPPDQYSTTQKGTLSSAIRTVGEHRKVWGNIFYRQEHVVDNTLSLLRDGKTWNTITEMLGCSRATIAKVKKLNQ